MLPVLRALKRATVSSQLNAVSQRPSAFCREQGLFALRGHVISPSQAYGEVRFTSSLSHLCPQSFQRTGHKNVSSALPPSRTVLCRICKIPPAGGPLRSLPAWLPGAPESLPLLLCSLSLSLSSLVSRQQEDSDSWSAPLSTKASEGGSLPLPLAPGLHCPSAEQDARGTMLSCAARAE